MKFKTILPILTVVVLGLILRLYQIDKVPPSLNWDEVSHGYNAYSILKTGKDEWGQSFPLTNFRAYGDYPLPLNLYLTIPFILALGLNDFSIRLPHILLGTLTIVSVYFLAYSLTRKNLLSLLASFLVAVGPWYVLPSRFVIQSNLSVFLLVSSMAFFFGRTKNKFFLPLSFLCLGLTLFSYHSTRIFSPLLLVAIILMYRREFLDFFKKEKLAAFLSLVILAIFFLPLPLILFNPEARARSNWVFLVDQGAIGEIENQRQTSNLGPVLAKLLYNRPVYFTKQFAVRYLEYFSPKFLFFKGGTQYQFSIPDKGLLYLVNLPFFYLGLFLVARYAFKGKKDYQFLLLWISLAPIPASITQDHFAVLRSTPMLPLPEVLTALGFVQFYNSIQENSRHQSGDELKADMSYFDATQYDTEPAEVSSSFRGNPALSVRGGCHKWVTDLLKDKRWLIAMTFSIYAILFLNQMRTYIIDLFAQYSTRYSWSWQYGYKEVVSFIKDNYESYDKIIITKKYGEPQEFVLFYWPWEPDKHRTDPNLIWFYQSNWYWVDRFDKFYFVNDWDIPKVENGQWKMEKGGEFQTTGKTLLITSPENYPPGWKLLKTVNFLDGRSAFDILRVQ